MKSIKLNCTRKEAILTFELWKLKNSKRYNRLKKSYCEKCKGTKVIQLHHIDGDKRNNSSKNLINLCNKCHNYEHHNNLHIRYVDTQSNFYYLVKLLSEENTEFLDKVIEYCENIKGKV